jgi:dephospho-CoA kinase
MKVYGLTGGIGSGKSLAARRLRELGAEVIDADELAREVVRVGSPGLGQLVDAFGREILASDGTLDRKRLGAIVFADTGARAKINSITHPLIAAETTRRLAALAEREIPLAFYEAALLVENGAYAGLAGLIVVEADPATQQARIQARDGIDAAEAQRRIAAQATNEQRRAAATLLLRNDGSRSDLEAQVDALYARLSRDESL